MSPSCIYCTQRLPDSFCCHQYGLCGAHQTWAVLYVIHWELPISRSRCTELYNTCVHVWCTAHAAQQAGLHNEVCTMHAANRRCTPQTEGLQYKSAPYGAVNQMMAALGGAQEGVIKSTAAAAAAAAAASLEEHLVEAVQAWHHELQTHCYVSHCMQTQPAAAGSGD